MYLHMLDKDEQELFMRLAILLKYSDDEIVWDGPKFEEITGETDINKISFIESPEEQAVLAGFVRELDKLGLEFKNKARSTSARGSNEYMLSGFKLVPVPSANTLKSKCNYNSPADFQTLFGELLAKHPLPKQNDAAVRLEVCAKVIDSLLATFKEGKICSSEGEKIIIYELFSLALADGIVSDIENGVIKTIANTLDMDSLDIDELFEAAQELNKLVVKSLSLILE